MSLFSAVLVVIPWYVSLLVFWFRMRVSFSALLSGLFSSQTIILSFFFLVFLPGVAIYANARWGAKRKRQNEGFYLFLTILVGVALGVVGSNFWMQNALNSNTLILILGFVVLLLWKFLWDILPRKL